MGLAAIALIFALVSVAAARVVRWPADSLSRADALLGTFVVTCSIFGVALYGLGLAHRMGAASSSLLVTAIAIAAFAWRRPSRAVVSASLRGALDWITLPWRALTLAARDRSLLLFLLPVGFLLALSMLFQAAILPPLRGSEVHEALVGFAIQAHGLGGAVGPRSMELLDARPQLGELIMAWVTLMTDHRFIDMPSVLAVAPLVLAMATLARHSSGDSTTGAAWGLWLWWLPAMALSMQTTRVELLATALVLSAANFAVQSVHHARNVWLANAACALAVATSPMALTPALILASAVLLRVLVAKRFAYALATLAPLAALGAVYGRNALIFGRPIVGALVIECGAKPTPIKLTDWIEGLVSPASGYGISVGWVVLPLGVIAIVALLGAALKSVIALVSRRSRWAPTNTTQSMMIICAAAIASLRASPDLNAPASNLVSLALVGCLCAWLSRAWPRLGREVATAVAMASLVSFAWHARWWTQSGRVVLSYKELAAVAALPDREFATAAQIDPKMGADVGSELVLAQAKTRDKTIGPGSIVAFTGDASQVVFALWNSRFENRVVFVAEGADFVQRVKSSNATWVYVHGTERDDLARLGFVELGPIVTGDTGTIMRRTDW